MATEKTKSKDMENLTAKVARIYLANKRHSLAKTKKRGEVSGGGKKPFRQKGTGRARAGSNRSPIWRGGGVVFGPTGNQNFALSANKKEIQAVLKNAFESKKSDTHTIETSKITKTKQAAELLKKQNLSGKTLVLCEDVKLNRFFKNIEDVKIMAKKNASALDVLWAKNIIILKEKAVKKEVESK